MFTAILADIPMKTLSLVDDYRPILAVRSIPWATDRNTLTNACFATLHTVLTGVIPGQFVILPQYHYHAVVVNRRKGHEHYSHPDLNDTTRSQKAVFIKECIWEVLLLLPEETMEGTIEERTLDCQKRVFTVLAKARNDTTALSPPFLAYSGGFQFEYMSSAQDFLASPRGPPGTLIPSGVRFYNVPPFMLA
jgi:hypothetical protein